MRPYQWIKNLFIFMPLIFGQQLFNLPALLNTTYMFFIFSLTASAVYLVNDIIDLEGDRRHPLKRFRPIPAGKITISQSRNTAFVLFSIAISLSFILERYAGYIILSYIALNYVYMKFLKNIVIIDVFCIGIFFYLRILAGATTSRIILSNWIILCTFLLALFLAFNKRRYDLRLSMDSHSVYKKNNIYFIDCIISVISSSILMSYVLYAMDTKTMERFGTSHLIYTVLFVYYGIFYYLYLLDERGLGGDPARILLKDRKLQLDLALWISACIAIIYFKL
jgi:4-hydroxybenzoate polyprenyltransferase